jgi:hypothetical protein
MFAEYFVTCNVAVALKEVRFDEPCMGYHESEQELNINYCNRPTQPELYNATIRKALEEKPGLFDERRKNSQLPQWFYAAPLYHQVFDWLRIKHNMRVHDCYIASAVNKVGPNGTWYANLIDATTGETLWPGLKFVSTVDDQAKTVLHVESQTPYETQREAWEAVILEAIARIKHSI